MQDKKRPKKALNNKKQSQKQLEQSYARESCIINHEQSGQSQTEKKCVQILVSSLKTKKIRKAEEKNNSTISKKNDNLENVSDVKSIQYYDSDNEIQDLQDSFGENTKKTRNTKPATLRQILFCQSFKQIKEIELLMYYNILAKYKIYSTMLINEMGQVIYADRLASQHFQGSLNNMERNPIQSMILQCEQTNFYSNLLELNPQEQKVLKILIYSKNSKRRYSKISKANNFLTNQDIFNRYLKCLSLKIQPIQITISDTSLFEGFWNTSLFQINKPLKYYLLRSRLAMKAPKLDNLSLKQDPKIIKFIRYTMKKQKQNTNNGNMTMQKQQGPYEGSKEEIDFNSVSKKVQKSGVDRLYTPMKQARCSKMDEQLYEEEEVKHSKTVLTRGYLLNSGGGKQKQMGDSK